MKTFESVVKELATGLRSGDIVMGWHNCEYCGNKHSSGDVTLAFDNGHVWEMPDMIVHYVEEHNYMPSTDFVNDVTFHDLAENQAARSRQSSQQVGYLHGEYPQWSKLRGYPALFALRLRQLIEKATRAGNRVQTRGM